MMNRIHFHSLDSTHAFAMKNGQELEHWTVVTADYQTAGRGRSDRRWVSPEGMGLLCSIVIKEPLPAPQLATLIHVMAVSVADFICVSGLTPEILWPNDILVRGKKIAGLLAESVVRGGRCEFAVLSAGININHDREILTTIDRPATSLFAETGVRRSPEELFPYLIRSCEAFYRMFADNGFAPVRIRWKKWDILEGERVVLKCDEGSIEGIVAGFDDDCAIRIADKQNSIRIFHSGEIERLAVIKGS